MSACLQMVIANEPRLIKMDVYNLCMLCWVVQLLPCKFVKDYLPRKSGSIELRNGEGKSWSVKYLFRIYYATFSAGWSAFARDNRLKVGDECIFELVEDKVMHVHVI